MGAEVLGLIAAGNAAAGLVGFGAAWLAWRHREVPAATAFAAVAGVTSLWSVTAAGEAVSLWAYASGGPSALADPFTIWLLERAIRVTASQVPSLLFVFVVVYAGHEEWLSPRSYALLWAYPLFYCVVSLTAPWHGYASPPDAFTLVTAAGVTAPVVENGVFYELQVAHSYVVIALAYAVLARLGLKARRIDQRQIAVVALATLFPVAANVAYNAGFVVHPGVDVTPAAFAATALVLGWELYRNDVVAVMPLPSDLLVDQLPDPVLVLDEDDVVVEANPAARALFDGAGGRGEHVDDVAPALLAQLDGDGLYSVAAGDDGPGADAGRTRSKRYFRSRDTRIRDQHGRPRGRLVVLREVTGQQRRQRRLEALQAATQRFISATTDLAIAEQAVEFAERTLERETVAVLLADAAGERLQPVAVGAAVADRWEEPDLVARRGSATFDAFEAGETRRIDDGGPFDGAVVYPLGEHGVLAIGAERDREAGEEDQFAAILARTTQVALAQIERRRELRRSQASVERRNEQIAFFNGVLRHALRNALLVIQGRTEHLAEHVPADQAHHLDRIEQWCDDLAGLTEEIRKINDTVTASESERLDAVDLSDVLRARARAVEAEYDAATVDVAVPEGLTVLANELVEKVLESVLRNGVEHNDRSEPAVRVTAFATSDRVQVRIADDGPGMAEEIKETVFEREFATTQTASGFGLYFVSVMMHLYGGAVWFEDNDPRGTVAVLEFQRASDADAGGQEAGAATGEGSAGS